MFERRYVDGLIHTCLQESAAARKQASKLTELKVRFKRKSGEMVFDLFFGFNFAVLVSSTSCLGMRQR